MMSRSTPIVPNTRANIVYCVAGGTGGHVFPALAVADALLSRGVEVRLIVDRRAQRYVSGRSHRVVSAAGLVGRGWLERAAGLVKLAVGLVQSLYWVIADRPVLIVGFGGYASLPVVLAGQLWQRPTAIHEQNALMGRVNRLLVRHADCVLLSFKHTRRVPENTGTTLTGNPVPVQMGASGACSVTPVSGKKVLLVLGGSLGAKVFDHLVPRAVALLPEELRQRLQVWQQVSAAQEKTLPQVYAAMGVQAECCRFFPAAAGLMARADVLVCRAGGSTCAELLQVAIPAVLIPLPHAADNHQWYNARELAQHGGACLLEEATLEAPTLAQHLEVLLENQHQQASQMRKVLARLAVDSPMDRVIEALSPLIGTDDCAEQQGE